MDMMSISVFALALMVAAGTPGPSIGALVSRVLARGWRDVLPFVAAMWLGEVAWLLAALAGLTTLAQSFHLAFVVLKWAGVAYLVWMAVQMWRAPGQAGEGALPRRGSAWSMFGAGLAVTLGNPKIMVFYLALLPTLVDLRATGWGEAAVLAGVTLVTLAVVDLGWIALAQRARALLRTPRAVRLTNRASALVMGGAAAAIAAKA
ncbi:LysE family translocator [Pararhodobacter zhoushanensis]|uniref:LysE family translocator n=1 Tax=Pararhodobacter zhoushanensis TaxID=2479545 RepID=A0ABT3GYC3_9RHOB|nr:LysE family translocator [Pararhodobacter zhoushanensis]MCW1932536.1 LysE family translocator [Pararhodobacter zhoushanensis]